MSHSTFRKRQREQTQRERRLEKEARRNQRKTETPLLPGSHAQDDPDLAGMVLGPQRLHEEEDSRIDGR
ncbi:MAG: hypothetical protein HY348_07415 [Nitrospira defluvii]|nr:hypothetical protein [Nitrospira defluvii]